MASTPKPYNKFPINSYKEYEYALEKSETDLFWGVPDDIEITDDNVFNFYIDHHNQALKNKNHVWLNNNKYNGLVLFSKNSIVSNKEIEYRFIADRIEHDSVVSKPKPFNVFSINNYKDYLDALDRTETQMFLGVPSDVIVNDFDINAYFYDADELDTGTTHLFLNGENFDGVVLFSKGNPVTEKEVEHRFYTNKKEHNIVVSNPRAYEKFVINNYNDYLSALKETKSDMFWGIPSDVDVCEDFDFDLYFSHHNKFDREINHVFLNNEFYDGVVLFSKKSLATEKEVEARFYVNKKEWKTVASNPKKYEKFTISNYDDYLRAREQSKTEMFYMIYDDIVVVDDFKFDLYITHHNQYERKINHVWKNGNFYDGIALTTKSILLTKHEIDYRFLAIKKEYEQVASVADGFDIVFISNGEANAEQNYQTLLKAYPNAKRVDKVKGIHQAHIAAAKLVNTKMFWVVDGDAEILEDFEFDHQIAHYDIDGYKTVFVWRSLNPVNDLIYGYGGVKLLPTQLTIDMDVETADMTTSISKNFKGINRMSNVTAFNTDAFSAWRSGFRECAKLASKAIDRQVDDETTFRLKAWCSRGFDKPFGAETIAGAYEGAKYGLAFKNNKDALRKINDFKWLNDKFKNTFDPDITEYNIDFLDESEEDLLIKFNPVAKSIFTQIEKKLGNNYKYSAGSVKMIIDNVGEIYFDSKGVKISKAYADAEIIVDLKTALKALAGEVDTLELYKAGDLIVEGDVELAQDFFADLRKKIEAGVQTGISLYIIELNEFLNETAHLNLSLEIEDVGNISINGTGIKESAETLETNIKLVEDDWKQLLAGELTIIELIQEQMATYTGDILQVIELNQLFHYRETHR
tara:strand:+ start:37 stop:2622 length:2586 start_codon:yes stop_codon:yes gene_type:complete